MGMTPIIDLIERLGIARGDPRHPAVLATAAAVLAVSERDSRDDIFGIGLSAILNLPKTAHQFERGIACGIAMMLATEPPR